MSCGRGLVGGEVQLGLVLGGTFGWTLTTPYPSWQGQEVAAEIWALDVVTFAWRHTKDSSSRSWTMS